MTRTGKQLGGSCGYLIAGETTHRMQATPVSQAISVTIRKRPELTQIGFMDLRHNNNDLKIMALDNSWYGHNVLESLCFHISMLTSP